MRVVVKGLAKNRHGTFRYRKVLPPEIAAKLGQSELLISLDTKDAAVAVQRLPAAIAKAEERIAAVVEPMTLSPREAQALADHWLAAALEEDEGQRRAADFPTTEPDERDMTPYEDERDALLAKGRSGDFNAVWSEVDQVVREASLAILPKSRSWDRLAERLLLAKAELLREQDRRARGDWSGGKPGASHIPPSIVITAPSSAPAPSVSVLSKAASGTPKLRDLFKRWKKERKPSEKTDLEFSLAVDRFCRQHGDVPVGAISKTMVVKLKDNLLEEGKSAATVTKQVGCIRSLLQYAVDSAELEHNPASGVRVLDPDGHREKRLPFTADHLQTIFGSDVFTAGERPKGGAGEAAYWLPLLGLLTGARLAELASLRKEDVGKEDDTHFVDIHDRDEGRSVKTRSSRRQVPLHPDLIRLGFLDYVAELPEGSAVFPLVKTAARGQVAKSWSQWFARFLDELKITDKRLTFHSFRHTFKNLARAAEIPEDVHDAITGHAAGHEGRRYGGNVHPLPKRAKALAAIKVDAVARLMRSQTAP
jgi:integrase